jgi:phosphatidylserine decarboxylase
VVVSSGRVVDDDVTFEPIKGVRYELTDLLGDHVKDFTEQRATWWWPFWKSKQYLYHATIYLAPGDYHRFHSPADITVDHVQLVDGLKLPVSPWFMSRLCPETLALNKRARIVGTLGDGTKTALIPVAALNVSSIEIGCREGTVLRKGEELGAFRMGSTVVLVFTSSDPHLAIVNGGQRVRMGESITHSHTNK